jgi:hypothetical protein
MNPFMAPALASLVAVGLLVLSVGVGAVLQLSRRTAPVGKLILWYTTTALVMAIIFAWLAPIVLVPVLGLTLGERGARLALWGSGLIGLVVGILWARRHPGGQHVFRGKPVRWWILSAIALVLFGLGLWLAWQASTDMERPAYRVGFWTWLAHTVGLK